LKISRGFTGSNFIRLHRSFDDSKRSLGFAKVIGVIQMIQEPQGDNPLLSEAAWEQFRWPQEFQRRA